VWLTETVPVSRVAEVPLILSDGTKIPRGATLGVPTLSMTDPKIYSNPLNFDGHRFLKLSQQSGSVTKYSFVGTSNEHIFWGHGRHACPGRFFAANEIKILLVHLLQRYEFKFADGGTERPKILEMGADMVPNPEVGIFIRSRKRDV
jgi:cytochrome P450